MLQELSIRQFAIIDDIRMAFDEGLTILSGETGAGKSIIIQAVNLLLGSRASEKMIRTGADSAEIEALFRIDPKGPVAQSLADQDFPTANELLIRRVISRNNRHRIYINDRLSTMQVLKTLVQHMASISGQHAHQGLLKEDQQLSILDQTGGLLPLRQQIHRCYHSLVPLIQQYRQLLTMKTRQQDQLALLQFQQQEIQAAGIAPGEDEVLAQEITRLKNAEKLYDAAHGSIEALYSASGAVVERVIEVGKRLDQASQIDAELAPSSEALSECAYQIEDVVAGLRSYLGKVQLDAHRLEEAEERLDLLNTLKRKYGGTLSAVFETEAAIAKELSHVENLSEEIARIHQSLLDAQKEAFSLARQLSGKRQAAAKELARSVEVELATLKMGQTRFEVNLLPIPSNVQTDPFLHDDDQLLTDAGLESAQFLIAPNVGEALKPMSDIASGGELSRMVLALKAILAHSDAVETIIFDEVDAGIGGTVAEVVGKKLLKLSRFHQVICITHLPQIARFGHHQYKITKQVVDDRTATAIQPLDHDERIQEIARMLAGENLTAKTLAHAAEMMSQPSNT